MHFTDLSMRARKSTGRTTYYWDDSTPGFGIRVGKRRKTWTIMRGATRERISLGLQSELSLSDARKVAKRLLLEKPAPNAAPAILFETARDEFLAANYKDAALRTASEAIREVLRLHKAQRECDLRFRTRCSQICSFVRVLD